VSKDPDEDPTNKRRKINIPQEKLKIRTHQDNIGRNITDSEGEGLDEGDEKSDSEQSEERTRNWGQSKKPHRITNDGDVITNLVATIEGDKISLLRNKMQGFCDNCALVSTAWREMQDEPSSSAMRTLVEWACFRLSLCIVAGEKLASLGMCVHREYLHTMPIQFFLWS
jgi:hypothetical protein